MNYIILKDTSILLTMLASMISPVFILPTPSGVPVNMRSPCFNGTSAAISNNNSSGSQIMSAQEPDCLNWQEYVAKNKYQPIIMHQSLLFAYIQVKLWG